MTKSETERLIKLEVKVDDIQSDVKEIKEAVTNLDDKFVTRREAVAITSLLIVGIPIIVSVIAIIVGAIR